MARDFNGSSDYLLIPFNSALDFGGTGSFSISAWINPDNPTSADEKHIYRKDTGSGNRGLIVFRVSPLTGKLRFEVGNVIGFPLAFTGVDGDTALSSGTWTHAGAVRDRGNDTISVYKDGVIDCTPVTDNDGDISVTAGSTAIGVWYADSTTGAQVNSYFDGKIAEVGAWNVALTDAEWAALGKGASPRFIRPESLVLYIPLVGRHSPEIDLINGFNGVATGTTQYDHPRIINPSKIGIAPTVTSAAVSPSELTATFSVPSPTVSAIQNATVSPLVQDATFSVQSPTVTTTSNALITPSVLSATFSIPSPTISAVQNVTVSPSVLTSTFSVLSPTVALNATHEAVLINVLETGVYMFQIGEGKFI